MTIAVNKNHIMEKYYYSFNDYLRNKFGVRVHRISLNAGFSCPNRDGTKSDTGCIFCNEEGFSRYAAVGIPLKEQIQESIDFLKKRFNADKFIAYFQNGTNTYASLEKLKSAYDVIRTCSDIVGIFISTRPDSVDENILKLIASYRKDYAVWIEYGLQTVHDATLEKINRRHTFFQSCDAIERTSKYKIKIGVHIILGLPGESEKDMMKTIDTIATLPISGVKFHALHVLRNTALETLYNEGKVKMLTEIEYIKLICDALERLSPTCVILRLVSDAKSECLVSPEWINNKARVIDGIKNEFARRGTRQGVKYD